MVQIGWQIKIFYNLIKIKKMEKPTIEQSANCILQLIENTTALPKDHRVLLNCLNTLAERAKESDTLNKENEILQKRVEDLELENKNLGEKK